MDNDKKVKGSFPPIVVFIISIVIVFLLWGLNWRYLIYQTQPKNNKTNQEIQVKQDQVEEKEIEPSKYRSNEQRGTFGDMFGASTSLFSGLAFAGLLWAILLQRKEFKKYVEETAKHTTALNEELATQKQTNYIGLLEGLMDYYNSNKEKPYFVTSANKELQKISSEGYDLPFNTENSERLFVEYEKWLHVELIKLAFDQHKEKLEKKNSIRTQ